MARPRKPAGDTTPSRYRGADGLWHARVTMGRRPGGGVDRKHVKRSTKAELHVEICSECHPFYTGKQKVVDTGGRVARFQKRLEKAEASRSGDQ